MLNPMETGQHPPVSSLKKGISRTTSLVYSQSTGYFQLSLLFPDFQELFYLHLTTHYYFVYLFNAKREAFL